MAKTASKKKLTVMNSDSYLFSIAEAALLFRKNRDTFEKEFIESGELPFVLIGSRKYIRHSVIKDYLNRNEFYHQQKSA